MVWSAAAVAGTQLPEASAAAARRRLARRHPGAAEADPPGFVTDAVRRIRRLLAHGDDDLASVALDCDGVPEFDRRVYALARAVRPGATTTYGALAALVGDAGAARAVGLAMARNPFPIVVPCHRVLGASGALVGFSAHGGLDTKRRLLAIERAAEPSGQQVLFAAPPGSGHQGDGA